MLSSSMERMQRLITCLGAGGRVTCMLQLESPCERQREVGASASPACDMSIPNHAAVTTLVPGADPYSLQEPSYRLRLGG